MIPNPPIKGHELLWEGHVERPFGLVGWSGGCRCSAKPDDVNWHLFSVSAMKRWHRQHKAELRAQVVKVVTP